MGCASSAMEHVQKISNVFKEPDVITVEELTVPPPGSTLYPKEEGGAGGGLGSGAATTAAETTESAGGNMSMYSTVMASQMLAKTMARRREDMITAFNSDSSEKGSLSELESEQQSNGAEAKNIGAETKAEAKGEVMLVEGLNEKKPDVVAAINDQQASLETKMQQEKKQEEKAAAGKTESGPTAAAATATAAAATPQPTAPSLPAVGEPAPAADTKKS